MKKNRAIFVLGLCCLFLPSMNLQAQDPILEVIRQGVKKIIIAVDLKIQRLQNKTIWLQNAQKALENKMSELRLSEIGDWVEKQRVLYEKYFEELWQVKAVLTHYARVKEIIGKQLHLVSEYKGALALFKQDKNFSVEEIEYMGQVYKGILAESLKNMEQLDLVVSTFSTQMTDSRRIEIINRVNDKLSANLADLRDFNNQNKLLSIQRAKEKGEIGVVKRLYGF